MAATAFTEGYVMKGGVYNPATQLLYGLYVESEPQVGEVPGVTALLFLFIKESFSVTLSSCFLADELLI